MPSFRLAGPAQNVELFGIRLLGVDAHNGHKLLFTVAFFVLLSRISKALHDRAKIGIASSTYDSAGLPPIRVQMEPPAAPAR